MHSLTSMSCSLTLLYFYIITHLFYFDDFLFLHLNAVNLFLITTFISSCSISSTASCFTSCCPHQTSTVSSSYFITSTASGFNFCLHQTSVAKKRHKGGVFIGNTKWLQDAFYINLPPTAPGRGTGAGVYVHILAPSARFQNFHQRTRDFPKPDVSAVPPSRAGLGH